MTSPRRRILLIQGHPDASARHFGHSLAEAYAQGAQEAGHEVRWTHVSRLSFPILRSQEDWEKGRLPEGLELPQGDLRWAEHIVLFFPLWLGDMPALLKGFLEQVARPGFAFSTADGGSPFRDKALAGRSARVVVTMGMPALLYRWYFRAHSIKSLERNILGFIGISPVDETLIGGAGQLPVRTAQRWLGKLRDLGRAGR